MIARPLFFIVGPELRLKLHLLLHLGCNLPFILLNAFQSLVFLPGLYSQYAPLGIRFEQTSINELVEVSFNGGYLLILLLQLCLLSFHLLYLCKLFLNLSLIHI